MAVGIKHREQYPPAVRQFAISLHNVSPAGYRMVQMEFDGRLPSDSAIRNWHANADINSKPGIIEQSLKFLKLRVEEKTSVGQKLIGGLLFDEMAIRKLHQWRDGCLTGFAHLPGMDKKNAPVANNALVCMFTSINDDISINGKISEVRLPVAYYFITSMTAKEKHDVIKTVIEELLKCGVDLTGVTFDGLSSNPAFVELLGGHLNVLSDLFNPSFEVNGHTLNTLYDPSHVIKMIRGVLARNVLYDSENRPIKWQYFKHLVLFKNRRNCGLMHKMTIEHIDFHKDPMKVRLAVETFSASTADAMEFLMNQGHPQFRGAGPTVQFVRIINDIFDVFNSTKSRNVTAANPFKRMMSAENASQIFQLFDKASSYIKGLQYRPTAKLLPICKSQLKTGFVGCIVNMHSFKNIYNKYVVNDKIITEIPTQSLSQDHLENFFGQIRLLNGNNNNPDSQQFVSCIRKLLANTCIRITNKGNCQVANPGAVYNPYSNISTVTSRKAKPTVTPHANFTPDDVDLVLKELSEIKERCPVSRLTDLNDINVAYIAHSIETKIESSPKFGCEFCKDVFTQNTKIHHSFTGTNSAQKPCLSTFEICITADHFVKLEMLKGQFDLELIQYSILSSLDEPNLYTNSIFDEHPGHKSDLIKYIVNEFVRIKGQFIAKTVSLNELKNHARRRLARSIIESHC